MPWYNAVTGEHISSPSDDKISRDELVYRPSIYAKEELPTWAEVYEEFYLQKQYKYDAKDPNDNDNIDLYWQVPHKKYLIAIVCNQFNKMLYEDGLKDRIIKELNKHIKDNILGLQFTIYPIEPNYIILTDKAPMIYTIPMPSGVANPFIVINHNRVSINTLNSVKFSAVIHTIDEDKEDVIRHVTEDELNAVIEIMIQPFKDYFTGNIGWKDSEGNPIEGDPSCRSCTGAGYCAK